MSQISSNHSRLQGGRARLLLAVFGVAAVASLGSPAGAQAPASKSRVRTPHFTVLSNRTAADAEHVAAALEAFRTAFARLVPQARVDPLAPVTVFAFDQFSAYEPWAPRFDHRAVRVAGSFIGNARANYLALMLDEGPRAWNVAYHELTHLIVSQSMERPPAWFNEGIAEFYSTFTLTPDRDEAEVGHLMPDHLVLLRRERWVPLDDLLDVTTASPLYNESDKRSMFYAESWALVHYLFSQGPARTAQLFDYLARTAEGQGSPSAFRAAFGMAPGTLQDELERYVQQTEWPVQRYPLGQRVSAAATRPAAAAGEDGWATALAGFQLLLGRTDDAMSLAQGAVNLDPADADPWIMLASAHVDRDMLVEAVPFIRKAAALPIDSPVAALLLGFSTIRVLEGEAEGLPVADGLRIAIGSLERAVAMEPTYAEAWATLAHARLVEGDGAAALRASRKAFALAPTRWQYRLLEAQALMQRNQLAEARQLLDAIIERDAATPLADKAGEVLARITALEHARQRQ